MALIMNQVAKEKVKPMVVMNSVRQAILLPFSFQNSGSSGSHFDNQVLSIYLILRRMIICTVLTD